MRELEQKKTNLDENFIKLRLLEIASSYAASLDAAIQLYKKLAELFELG
jgi:hypothetical protein